VEYPTSTPELFDHVSDLDLERLVFLVEAQGLVPTLPSGALLRALNARRAR
jgi:hypothetical protein